MTERFDRFNDTSEPSDYDANIPAVADAARAMLAALEAAAAETSVFQWGRHVGNVMMPRARYDALESAIAQAKAAGITTP